jgi:hypothetical protein
MQEDGLTAEKFELASSWPQTFPEDQWSVAEELPLRRDVIALLTYLRDQKVTGTQSTGNLPLKAVHEICARFVDPPMLEEAIGEHVYRVRSETEVWPLFFRHLLVSVAGLVAGGPGKRWRLSPLGESFLVASAARQVWLLFVTWWTQINWAIASPYDFEDGYLPAGFTRLALSHLLDLPVGEVTPCESFSDRMIEDATLSWTIQDQDRSRRILQYMIEGTVIRPLVDFGILQADYEPYKTLGAVLQKLIAFRITPAGRRLLEAIREMQGQERL